MGSAIPLGSRPSVTKVFATQNGNSIDSFLAVTRGQNYGWDGTDRTIATNAEAVFVPAIAPVHVAYYDGELFPAEYRGSFFFASAMGAADQGAGVWSFGYDVETEVVDRRPAPFVRFRGTGDGAVSGIALGPDGIYFAPLNARDATAGVVYRVTYDPTARYPHQVAEEMPAYVLFEQLGCRSCHALNSVGGTVGPALDQAALVGRLEARLLTDAYGKRLERLTADDTATRAARQEVLMAHGNDRVVAWVKHRILDPKFDDPSAAMPDVGASEAEATALADYLVQGSTDLLGGPTSQSFAERIWDVIASKRFAAGVVLGFAAAAFLGVAAQLVGRRRSRKSAVDEPTATLER